MTQKSFPVGEAFFVLDIQVPDPFVPRINIEITNLWTTFLRFYAIWPKTGRLSTQVEEEIAQFLGIYLKSP